MATSKKPRAIETGQGHSTGANRAANRPNWGNVPPPEPINDGWGISPSPAPQYSSTTIRIRVSNPNIEQRARTQEEVAITIPGEGVINTSPSPPTKEDVTLAMIMHVMYVKRLGIKMVSPLLKLGLSNHIFVFMCVLSPLELSRNCSFP